MPMKRVVATELMDDPGVDAGELAENFDDIEVANRHFGGVRPVVREVLASSARCVLDVACGSGDIVRALARAAAKRNRELRIVGLDRSDAVLRIARSRCSGAPAIEFVRGDATRLPFGDASFDVVTCNLALHHFEPAQAVAVLHELRRVARIAPLVCDLERSRTSYLATVAFARLIAKNRLTKHDGPLSVKRAYTRRESVDLAHAAGWNEPVVRRSPYFRMILSDRHA
jgi:ubiquinone/menaquinone biosynthesis C-methylase UbiE